MTLEDKRNWIWITIILFLKRYLHTKVLLVDLTLYLILREFVNCDRILWVDIECLDSDRRFYSLDYLAGMSGKEEWLDDYWLSSIIDKTKNKRK